jgi:hypothetical protein
MSQHGFSVRHLDARMHFEPGGGPVALVMADSAGALREKYIATGEASAEEVARYVHGAQDPASSAIYYSTIAVIASKA